MYFQTGLGGEEYLSGGTPLYKIKKRFPLGYGRRYNATFFFIATDSFFVNANTKIY